MANVKVRSSGGNYSVAIGSGLLRDVARHPAVAGRRCFVVTTPRVLGLHGEALLARFPRRDRPVVLLVEEGERHKRIATIERLARELSRAGAHRDAVLLAFGGGVVGDMTGLLASIYMRGVQYSHLPTTLLAQVDASIGGKTGVNLPEGKNLLGTFHSPRAVIADIETLTTLSDREYRAGLFECVKCAIMSSSKLFNLMEKNRVDILRRNTGRLQPVIEQSIEIKAKIVGHDEREDGDRMLLNFGHTFGHAFESALNYRELLHGEAVGWGMLAALAMSVRLGAIDAGDAARARELILACGPLPRFMLSESAVMQAMASDKKRTANGQQFILARGIGSGIVARGVPEIEARRTVREVLREAAQA